MKRRYRYIILAAVCVMAAAVGCTKETQDEELQNNPSPLQSEVINIDTDELPYTEEEIFSQLFDINNKISVDIDISHEELLNLQKDYDKYSQMGSKSPIYRTADLDITIETDRDSYTYHIDDIGIRMKGNTSRKPFYSEEDGYYNLIHFRIDFQGRTFATLEKLEIKWNKNDDSTYIREYYAYEMYRANGVLAPHTNIVSTDVAGIHQGIFTIYEPVDEIFIEKYVDEKDQGGDLYKCGWTGNGASLTSDCSIGIEDEETASFYNYDLKTNKKSSNHEQLVRLIRELNSGSITKDRLAELVDMDNFLVFEAISYFIGNPDDLRNNYNNHYIYFLKSSGKAVFIPYDLDRCLGVTKDWNPTGDGMSKVSPFSQYASGANEPQKNPLYIYTVDEGGYYVTEFAQVLEDIAESKWLTVSNFEKIYNIARDNYGNLSKPEKQFYNAMEHDFYFSLEKTEGLSAWDGNASFAEYIEAKLDSYNRYIEKIK